MHPLMVYNSLTRTKVRFIPRDPKNITWYQCGPTVYAESHVGHARTYVSLDIIIRIMREFLGYNVVLCQNVSIKSPPGACMWHLKDTWLHV